jgi:tetratricopeptide (TPR) repeat protein
MTFRHNTIALILAGLWTIPQVAGIGLGMRPALAQEIPAAVGRAYALLDRGYVDDAIEAFRDALRDYPDSLPAQLGLAIAYRRSGKDDEAFQAYERVLELDPEHPLALKTLGLLGTYRKEWHGRGIEALTVLLESSPNDTEARALRATLYGYESRLPEALADYEILLQDLNPSADVLLGAAQIYTYTGNPARGLDLFNRYRQTNQPIVGYAAIAYARALRETGKPAEAIRAIEPQLNTFARIDNQAPLEARAELARAYLANQQPTQALAAIESLRSRPEAILTVARVLNEVGGRTNDEALTQESATLYRQAIAQTPNPPLPLLQEAADILSDRPADREYALQLMRQIALQQPDNPVLVVQQLALENQLGLISQAEILPRIQPAFNAPLPNNPIDLQRLAQALIRLDPPDPQLLPAYEQLLQAGVKRPFLNFRVAQIYTQLNNLDAARTALSQYQTAVTTPDPFTELLRGEIERRAGNYDTSTQLYQALLDRFPEDAELVDGALQGLVGVSLAQNQTDAAIALYDRLIERHPEELRYQIGRASLALQQQRISATEAEAFLEQWLSVQPETNTPQELLSLVGSLPPNLKREDLYTRLIAIDPYYMPLQFRLIQMIALRDPAAARARIDRMLAQDPTNIGAYFVQGEIAQTQGDLTAAEQAYQSALAWQPNNADALAALGGVRFQQRDFDKAQTLYEQALSIKPEDLGIRRSLAGLTTVQDHPIAALEELEQIQLQLIDRGASDPELSEQIQRMQEDFLRRRGFQPPWERF